MSPLNKGIGEPVENASLFAKLGASLSKTVSHEPLAVGLKISPLFNKAHALPNDHGRSIQEFKPLSMHSFNPEQSLAVMVRVFENSNYDELFGKINLDKMFADAKIVSGHMPKLNAVLSALSNLETEFISIPRELEHAASSKRELPDSEVTQPQRICIKKLSAKKIFDIFENPSEFLKNHIIYNPKGNEIIAPTGIKDTAEVKRIVEEANPTVIELTDEDIELVSESIRTVLLPMLKGALAEYAKTLNRANNATEEVVEAKVDLELQPGAIRQPARADKKDKKKKEKIRATDLPSLANSTVAKAEKKKAEEAARQKLKREQYEKTLDKIGYYHLQDRLDLLAERKGIALINLKGRIKNSNTFPPAA